MHNHVAKLRLTSATYAGDQCKLVYSLGASCICHIFKVYMKIFIVSFDIYYTKQGVNVVCSEAYRLFDEEKKGGFGCLG